MRIDALKESLASLKKLFSTRKRRILSVFSAAFLVASLGSGALGAYVLFSGGEPVIVNDDAVMLDLTKEPFELHIAPTNPEAARGQPRRTPSPPPLEISEYRMVIEDIGIYAPVRSYGLTEDFVAEVPKTGREVAWYNFSSRPGTGGNAVFGGHVIWGDGGVFYNLDELKSGDQIRLEGQDGTTLYYKASAVFQVNPKDPDSSKVMLPTDVDVLTIVTCSGRFKETGDPVTGGEYSHRLIVRAELVSIDTPAVAAP